MSLPQESLLTALRLCASAPAAALELLQEPLWTARQQLCQALATTLASGDWLALLPILNHEQAAVRLHWLASLLVDAQKRQQGITLVSNPDVWPLLEQLAHSLPAARLQAIAHDVCTCREQLLNVVGVNPRTAAYRAPAALGTLPATRDGFTRLPPLSETLCF